MIVLCVLLIVAILAFFVPKKYLRQYFLIASIMISTTYFFFEPPMEYDLYRHYSMLDNMRAYNLKEWLQQIFGNYNMHANTLLGDYISDMKVYSIFAYIIANIKISHLLPIIAGSIIYGFASAIIIKTSEDMGNPPIESWKMAMCFTFLLCLADFRSVSGIRNMMAYAIFAYTLYKDLVRKSNVVLCFVIYFILANIHSSIYILIAIRILVEVCIYVPKWLIATLLAIAYSGINFIILILEKLNSFPMVEVLLKQVEKYVFGNISDYNIRNIVIRALVMLVYCLIYLYVRYFMGLPNKFYKFGDYFILLFFFTFGAIAQYDIFIRHDLILLFISLPFVLYFLKYVVGSRATIIRAKGRTSSIVLAVLIYGLLISSMFLSVSFYTRYYYLNMDQYFNLGG